jgi:hypothetical protein
MKENFNQILKYLNLYPVEFKDRNEKYRYSDGKDYNY